MDSAGSSNFFLFRRVWPAAVLLALAFCCLAASGGAVYAQTPVPAYDEAEAQAIDRMLICPVCPAESIDQAQVPLARQMRQRVREMLAAGAGRQEILDWFADRYGTGVLAAPPKTGVNLLAWTLPIVGVLAALAVGGLAIRAMTGRRREAAAEKESATVPEGELAPYLAAVDRSLSLPDRESQAGDGGAGVEDDRNG